MKVSTALNIPDVHIPFHDKKAWRCMIKTAQEFDKKKKLTEINILGDFADFFWFSLHPKAPEQFPIRTTLKEEIKETIKHLEELRQKFPRAKIYFIEGNHEYRMMRYICNKAPELFEFFTLPELLHFKRLKINYVPYGKYQLKKCLGTNYYLRHEPYAMGDYCAGGSLKKGFVALGFGHTHRTQSYAIKRPDGVELETHSLGWLGDSASPVFSYVKNIDTWTQGFQFVTAFGTDDYHIENIRIKNGKAVWAGRVFKG